MEVLLLLLGLAFVFGPWIIAIVALLRADRLSARVEALERAAAVPPLGASVAAETAPEPPPEPAAEPPLLPLEPVAEPPEPAPHRTGLEEALASRWLVWLGAVAVGLSAVFLVGVAIEEGWLGPEARVALGVALGVALILGGERVRQRAAGPDDAPRPVDAVAPSLTAAGAFALYATVFAAHGFLDLIGAPVAFALLAVVSLAALALALRQGLLVGVLGLGGGYLVPALISSDTPQAGPVFLYLAVLSTACLALMRWRSWRVLAVAVVAGGLGWPLLWLAGPWTEADRGLLGLYAVVLSAAFGALGTGWPLSGPLPRWLRGPLALLTDSATVGYALCGLLLLTLTVVEGYGAGSMLVLALYALVGLGLGFLRAGAEALAVAGAVVVGAAMLMWPLPSAPGVGEPLPGFDPPVLAQGFGPSRIPEVLHLFARTLAGFALLYGAGGLAALRQAPAPGLWAALAAAVPLWLLGIAYGRIGGFAAEAGWGLMAGALAALNVGAAFLVHRWLEPSRQPAPLGAFAAGATAALALGFACVFREAWLTVAIALQVPALAWLWTRLHLPALRVLIAAVAVATLVRLVLNPAVLDYGGADGTVGWVLYGYGVPALAFLAAARLLRGGGDDALGTVCASAGVGFAILMVALQLRLWTAGALGAPRHDLFDQSVQTLWWLVAAGLLLRDRAIAALPTARWGGVALLSLAVAQIVLGHLLAANPIYSTEPVGSLPIVNRLGLAYLVPALLLLRLAADEGLVIGRSWRTGLRVLAGGLVFAFVTFEVRRAFQGPVLEIWRAPPGAGEIYAYSAAWIVLALGLLGVGIARADRLWRHAALGVLAVAVVKVFLYDMADLGGLLRVASFLGLGLALIGLGWLYRRFGLSGARG